MLDGRVRLDKDQLTILDPRPTQDPLLDEALARLAAVGRLDHDDPEWFQQIVHAISLGEKLVRQLLDKGIIYRQEKKGFMGLSKTITFPFRDPTLPLSLFESERAVMLHGAKPDRLTAAQIFMAYCWGTVRPWDLSRQEDKLYDKRWETLFGDYWGWYDRNQPTEPIEGISPDLAYAIADLTISWATVHSTYVMDDVNWYRELLG
jgi:hypothetical protein